MTAKRRPTTRQASAVPRADEARWLAMLGTARDAIISIDAAGRITFFNRSAEEVFGYLAGEVLGQNVAMLMPLPHREEHGQFLRDYEQRGIPRVIGQTRNVQARRKNGEIFPIELSVSEARIGTEALYTAIIRDASVRQQMEEALRRERDFAERLLDTAPVIVLVLDTAGRIVRFNSYMEETSGYQAADVQGLDWFDTFLPARDRDRIREAFALPATDDAVRGYVNPIVTRNGTEREIEWNSRPLKNAQGQVVGILCVGRDITDRRRAERQLAAQYAVTRVLAEADSLAEATPRLLRAICEGMEWDLGELWEVDAQATVLRWQGLWHKPNIDGIAFETISRPITFSLDSGLPGRVWATAQPFWITDFAAHSDYLRLSFAQHLGLHGACGLPLRKGNDVIGVMAFFSRETRQPDRDALAMFEALGQQVADFLQRKRAEEALRQSERRFAEFMHHLPGVAFMKDLEGRYVYVNGTFERLFHQQLRHLLGKTDAGLWPPETVRQLEQNDRQVIEQRESLQTTETVPHDDGPHDWLVTKFPILDEQGAPVLVAGVAVDITERRRAESELRTLQKVTQQRERLADIGAITAQIVHDLGNPLAAISMQAQLIANRARRDATQPVSTVLKAAEQIAARVRHVDSLIKEFLDFARGQRLNLTPIELRSFLQEIADLWRPVAERQGIALTLEFPADPPALRADEEKLRRVLDNLVKNAVDAIGKDAGAVTIRVSEPAADKVRISVEDSGPGIPQDLEVFRLFETTKPDGSGLGLPIVRQIIMAHGGGIEFASVAPHGTVFHVDLLRNGPVF